MTKVKFDTTSDTFFFSCQGHAGYAEHGQDIVCASASILAYTLVECIYKMQTEGKINRIDEILIQDGLVNVVVEIKKEFMQECLSIFSTLKTGFELLAENYPQYVEIDIID